MQRSLPRPFSSPSVLLHHLLTGLFKSQSQPAGSMWEPEVEQDLRGALTHLSAKRGAADESLGIKRLGAQQLSSMLVWPGRAESSYPNIIQALRHPSSQ